MKYEPVLFNTVSGFAQKDRISFHMPVHSGGKLYGNAAENILRLDTTELDATDNLAAPKSAIKKAHTNMARLFGADNAHMLVGGSSAGIHAMLLSCLRRGDTVLVDRCAHQSVINACVLYGFIPVFFEREYLDKFCIAGSISIGNLSRTIDANPHAKAVLITTPTYYGVCSDTAAITQLAHSHNMPLLADCAHGSHFAFSDALPNTAVADGADLCTVSLHKTLGAPTQSALLLHRFETIPFERVKTCINMIHTTSPSYMLMCASDLACAKMAAHGNEMFAHAISLTKYIKHALEHGSRLRCLPEGGDLTRLVVNFGAYALSGYKAAALLADNYKIDVEMADAHNIVCIIGPLASKPDADALINALCAIGSAAEAQSTAVPFGAPPKIVQVHPPDDAFFSSHTYAAALGESAGKICAASVSVYPPGAVCLTPGALITQDAVQYIQNTLSQGGTVIGLENGRIRITE